MFFLLIIIIAMAELYNVNAVFVLLKQHTWLKIGEMT